jgi:hypothetical protein
MMNNNMDNEKDDSHSGQGWNDVVNSRKNTGHDTASPRKMMIPGALK